MKTKSGMNFLENRFNMELMSTEGLVSGEKQVDQSFKLLVITEAVEVD